MNPADNTSGGHHGLVDWHARKSVLPIIAAAATGPLSRWSAGHEQDLDNSQAGKIAAHLRQDTTRAAASVRSAQSVKMPDIERMAPGLVRLTFPARDGATEAESSVSAKRTTLISGLAARAWEDGPGIGVLSEYCPASWHHPQGIKKILRRLLPRLPDVSGGLFLTLTFDRKLFADAGSAHDTGRPQIRKVMDRLRKGIAWSGKTYQIDAAYCVKLEFHQDEWPHYHLIILTRRYVPKELLTAMWANGICDVRRINNHKFHYLLKYVTKGGGYPEWVLNRKRLRIFQPSHGFMVTPSSVPKANKPKTPLQPKRKRASYTIGQRLYRWSRMALYNEHGKFYSTIPLARPFRQTFDVLVLSIAEGNRYLGNGFIKINQAKELIPWMLN